MNHLVASIGLFLPGLILGLLLTLWGWGAYTHKRLAFRFGLVTGKKAQARGLLLALWGLTELVTPLLFIGRPFRDIDVVYFTMVGEPILFFTALVLLLI